MGVTLNFPPRLMQATAAAHYLGMSKSKFLTLGITPRAAGGLRLYDIHDLDRYADALAETDSQDGKWDDLFEGQSG